MEGMKQYFFLLLIVSVSSTVEIRDIRKPIKWKLMNQTTPHNTLLISKAFELWQRYSAYNFERLPDDTTIDIKVTLKKSTEIDNLKEKGLALANRNEIILIIDRLHDDKLLYNAVVHEIGHTLLQDHVNNTDSIMFKSSRRQLDFNEKLPMIDRKRLKTFLSRHQCLPVDSVSFIPPYTYLAFKDDLYYLRNMKTGYQNKNLIQNLISIYMPRIDAFFPFPNNSFGIVSNNSYWIMRNISEVPQKIIDFNRVLPKHEMIQAGAYSYYYNATLFITNNYSFLFNGNRMNIEYVIFKPRSFKSLLGIYNEGKYIVWIHTDYHQTVYEPETYILTVTKKLQKNFKSWCPRQSQFL